MSSVAFIPRVMSLKLVLSFLALACILRCDTSVSVPDLAILAKTVATNQVKIPPPPTVTNLVLQTELPAKPEQVDYLSLWRVRILLTILIIAITGALGVAVVQTARVFGLVADDNEIETKKSAVEQDPESLTRLLTSHTMRGYGSVFTNALSTNKEAALIIQ